MNSNKTNLWKKICFVTFYSLKSALVWDPQLQYLGSSLVWDPQLQYLGSSLVWDPQLQYLGSSLVWSHYLFGSLIGLESLFVWVPHWFGIIIFFGFLISLESLFFLGFLISLESLFFLGSSFLWNHYFFGFLISLESLFFGILIGLRT